ncbi:MAG: Fe-S oxidoreductase, partial [Armatimonadetes bacterium]|nr:Fe-S oxidoreductase [Armatimonadota bacterium]
MNNQKELNVLPGVEPEDLLECVHCGICLSVCPTYDLLGNEADSPRGRIYMIRALAEGRTELNENIVGHLDSCLGCRACETACPAAVPYGEFLTSVRGRIEKEFPRPAADRRARRVLLDMLTNPGVMAPAMFGAKVMNGIFGKGGGPVGMVNRFLFGPNAPAIPVSPDVTPTVQPLPEVTPAKGKRRARVLMLGGCVMQVLFQRVNRATIRVLAENGCEVVVPRSAGCCGAFQMHNGFLDDARTRARALIQTYECQEFDAIVINSAGCGSSMKEYAELFHDEPEWKARGAAIAAKSKDVSEFLDELGFIPPTGTYAKRVTYHDACHLAHAQKVRSAPRELLKAVPGLELVEFKDSDWCCGSAGIYNFLQPELAAQLQERKVDNVLAVKPEVVATG